MRGFVAQEEGVAGSAPAIRSSVPHLNTTNTPDLHGNNSSTAKEISSLQAQLQGHLRSISRQRGQLSRQDDLILALRSNSSRMEQVQLGSARTITQLHANISQLVATVQQQNTTLAHSQQVCHLHHASAATTLSLLTYHLAVACYNGMNYLSGGTIDDKLMCMVLPNSICRSCQPSR